MTRLIKSCITYINKLKNTFIIYKSTLIYKGIIYNATLILRYCYQHIKKFDLSSRKI